jgi:hypothetical protein
MIDSSLTVILIASVIPFLAGLQYRITIIPCTTFVLTLKGCSLTSSIDLYITIIPFTFMLCFITIASNTYLYNVLCISSTSSSSSKTNTKTNTKTHLKWAGIYSWGYSVSYIITSLFKVLYLTLLLLPPHAIITPLHGTNITIIYYIACRAKKLARKRRIIQNMNRKLQKQNLNHSLGNRLDVMQKDGIGRTVGNLDGIEVLGTRMDVVQKYEIGGTVGNLVQDR